MRYRRGTPVSASFDIIRNGEDITVHVEGEYLPPSQSSLWDEPDDEASVVDVRAIDDYGRRVILTHVEYDRAVALLKECEEEAL